jgi:HEAT repeat protein
MMEHQVDHLRAANYVLQSRINRLLSLHDGDAGVLDVVAYGPSAIPELRRILCKRERSGLYEPRRRVVETLAALGAEDVLVEFLESARQFPDPVENAGEEAVLNAAARALRRPCDDRAFRVLLSLAERRGLAGAIDALGRCGNPAALPCFLNALDDDLARPAAETVICTLGAAAWPGLVQVISERDGDHDSGSSRRRRRSALSILLETGGIRSIPPCARRRLIADDDSTTAILACRASLGSGSDDERRAAIQRLVDLLSSPQSRFRKQAEECLLGHLDAVREVIGPLGQMEAPDLSDMSSRADALRALLRIAARIRMNTG